MNVPEYRGAGVYKIDFGSAVYVGSSMDVKKRIEQHFYAAERGKEPRALQAAFTACPSPHVDILEKIGDNELVIKIYEREQYWIKEVSTGGLNVIVAANPQPEYLISRAEKMIKEYERRINLYKVEIDTMRRKYLVPISEKRRSKHGNRQKKAGN